MSGSIQEAEESSNELIGTALKEVGGRDVRDESTFHLRRTAPEIYGSVMNTVEIAGVVIVLVTRNSLLCQCHRRSLLVGSSFRVRVSRLRSS